MYAIKKLTTAGGMVVHCFQVHKENITKVPNAKPGRDSIKYEIYGMEGIPDENENGEDDPAKKPRLDGPPLPDQPATFLPGAPSPALAPNVSKAHGILNPGFGVSAYPPQPGVSSAPPTPTPSLLPSPQPLPTVVAQGMPQVVATQVIAQGVPQVSPHLPPNFPPNMMWGRGPQPGYMGGYPPGPYPPGFPAPYGSPFPFHPPPPGQPHLQLAPSVPGQPYGNLYGAQSVHPNSLDHTATGNTVQSILIYEDNEVSMEEKRAELDRYRYDESKIKQQIDKLDKSIETRLSNMGNKFNIKI
eukprot:TRINITY_DN3832_c0_g1_i1.p1 TRINITY_DN3832_c0_g1~~TRINITY_DN3832_c0_g1_i1.p1  ORF type:complete len:300 (-),score=55.33 TRINITY_DN3832_c0_g1_i1:2-901(-)